jgi:ribosomal protein L28
MPASCAITGVTYKKVHKRSKSMQSTITRVRANLQRIKIGNKRIKISARAMRTLKKKMSLVSA